MIEGHIAGMARELVRTQIRPGTTHKEESAYRSLCEGLPILLRTAGLTRTVAFLSAKRKPGDEYSSILDHLQMQLQEAGINANAKDRSLNLLEWVTSPQRTTAEYRHVSSIALRVAYWHKRLAPALLRKKEGR